MRDIVHWALPGGPLGELIAGRDVRRRVQSIMDFRAEALRKRFALLAPPARKAMSATRDSTAL
jgi:hypothetical protein